MATGLSSYLANKFLDAVGNATAYSAANVFVKLHIGDPGADGTGNPATETTRQSVSFGAATGGDSPLMRMSHGQTLQVQKMQHSSPHGITRPQETSCLAVQSQATLIPQEIHSQFQVAL